MFSFYFIRSFIHLFKLSFIPFIQQGVTPTFTVVTSSPTAQVRCHPCATGTEPKTEQHGKNNATPEKMMEINYIILSNHVVFLSFATRRNNNESPTSRCTRVKKCLCAKSIEMHVVHMPAEAAKKKNM